MVWVIAVKIRGGSGGDIEADSEVMKVIGSVIKKGIVKVIVNLIAVIMKMIAR